MKPWSIQSISGRLTALVVVVSGTALLLAYISYLAYDFYSLRHNLIESIDSQANLIGINSESALLFDDQQAAEATLSALRGAPAILTAEVLRLEVDTSSGDHKQEYFLIAHNAAGAITGEWGIECYNDCNPMESSPWAFTVTTAGK